MDRAIPESRELGAARLAAFTDVAVFETGQARFGCILYANTSSINRYQDIVTDSYSYACTRLKPPDRSSRTLLTRKRKSMLAHCAKLSISVNTAYRANSFQPIPLACATLTSGTLYLRAAGTSERFGVKHSFECALPSARRISIPSR
jgi:hypothetical protein